MEMNKINEILRKYSHGEADLEETNAALEEAGASFHLDPDRNRITEEEMDSTITGEKPEQASGFGLLDTGTGTLDKVKVKDGVLEFAVNQVREDGSTNMTAFVLIGGKRYEVKGDRLAEVTPYKPPEVQKIPKTPDMRRRPDLAGQVVTQHTRSGDFDVHYDELGYAGRATRAGWKPAEDPSAKPGHEPESGKCEGSAE